MSALTAPKQISKILGTLDSAPQAASTTIYQGSIVMLDSSGNAKPGATATGCIGVGVADSNKDLGVYNNASGSAGDLTVTFETGILGPFVNSSSTDALAAGDEGKICYIVDSQTVAKTDGGSTRSPAGRVYQVTTAGVFLFMGVSVGRQCAEEQQLITGATAFTQTYSTALATVAAALTDSTGGTASSTLASITAGASYAQADMAAVKNAIASLAADNLGIKKVINSLIDLLQAAGMAT